MFPLLLDIAVASLSDRAKLVDPKPLLRNRDDMDVAMLGMLVADGEPVDATTEVPFELLHHLLRPRLKVELVRRVLMFRVRREHQAVDVVVLVDAVDALVRAEFADVAVAIPHLAVLALTLFIAAVDGVAHVAFDQQQGCFQASAIPRFHDRAGMAGHVP